MYRISSETMLRSVAYQGRRQISSPVAAEVRDVSGATHGSSTALG